MDLNKLNVVFNCIYCRDKLTYNKAKLIQHLKKGCGKKKNKCSHCILVETSGTHNCYVYLNEKNYHLDVRKDVLPLITWPDTAQYFTSNNDWKKIIKMDSDGSSSEEEEKEDCSEQPL
jgi:hypothetical protein